MLEFQQNLPGHSFTTVGSFMCMCMQYTQPLFFISSKRLHIEPTTHRLWREVEKVKVLTELKFNNNNNKNKILIKHEPLVYTRAQRAVQKN